MLPPRATLASVRRRYRLITRTSRVRAKWLARFVVVRETPPPLKASCIRNVIGSDSPVVTVVGPSALDLADHRTTGDTGTDLGGQPADGACLVRLQGLFHLHRLEHHHDVPLVHFLALADAYLDDGALHRCCDPAATRGCPVLLPFTPRRLLLTAPGLAPGEACGEHNFDPPAPDL